MAEDLHHRKLAEETVTILDRYTEFRSAYQVSFSLAEPGADGLPRIAAHFSRTDGTPFAESEDPLDRRFAHLKDQTAIVRPFYFCATRAKGPWDEAPANEFRDIDFDFAAIVGYGIDEAGEVYVRSLFFLPTDGLIARRKPDEDGVWRRLPLATYFVSQLSLDPRKDFARFLYLAERVCEGLAYQYDKMGYFYSCQ